ncbi:hypothetical protein PQG02_26880 [Nostoc sp. UHCC 0926]|uniref:hypothetical protein n=1 Tax=unclassified Nostoc TaxID=2593658 RepID=UPI00235DF20C|nr:hypothetical protein [Nostoc sp. UHCC 0926]WDD32248.1 hypothetical protein PQG02_26880 [Nostoc sp. UHCC 0926]
MRSRERAAKAHLTQKKPHISQILADKKDVNQTPSKSWLLDDITQFLVKNIFEFNSLW